MCETNENCYLEKNGGFRINFNQDFTSISVVSKSGYRFFKLNSVDNIDEIFCSCNEDTILAERLFSSNLVAVVTTAEPNKLKICDFKKGKEICNYSYPSNIISVKLNRSRLIVCLIENIYVHNIRDMKLLNTIIYKTYNYNLCILSINSLIAYPINLNNGTIQLYDIGNIKKLYKINAHETKLSSIQFSLNGLLLATASIKGTVIRLYSTKTGNLLNEYRRGVKRNVTIISINFSICSNYLCITSNTETIHIFKIDSKLLEINDKTNEILINDENNVNNKKDSTVNTTDKEIEETTSYWNMNFITKTVSSYLPKTFIQERSFATIYINKKLNNYNNNIKHYYYQCILTKLNNLLKLLIISNDGFLYIYNFDEVNGGDCKLLRVHDLRTLSDGDITEMNMTQSDYILSIQQEKQQQQLLQAQNNAEKPDEVQLLPALEIPKFEPITPTAPTITTSTPQALLNNKKNKQDQQQQLPGSYAGVLKGQPKEQLIVESDKLRGLNDAMMDYPPKTTIPIYDDKQFPPVALNID